MINRLWCLIVGHKKIRVIDKAERGDFVYTARMYGFRATKSHYECYRCKKNLDG